jgi:hypothetical protein
MGGSKQVVTQYPKTCFRPASGGTSGYLKSLEERGNEEGRPETEFPDVGLNPVGPGDLERVY